MPRSLQVTFRGMGHSDAVEERIRAKVEELDRFYGNVLDCRVRVEAPHRHHNQGKIFAVRVDLRVPGGELVVNRERWRNHEHEDVYVAIRDAFDAATRQLQEHARRQRGDVKRRELPLIGTVTKLFAYEDYGFLETSDGLDVYFHKNSVVNGGLDSLKIGSEVRVVLAEAEGEKGPHASTVVPIGRHHPVA